MSIFLFADPLRLRPCLAWGRCTIACNNWYYLYMPTFKISKLVRDKIVAQQIEGGSRPIYRRLDLAAHKYELINKLVEEAYEIGHARPDEIVSEIADLQQVLDDLRELYSLTADEVAAAQTRKTQKYGAFRNGIYIESVELDEHNEWVGYYRKNANRYTEM